MSAATEGHKYQSDFYDYINAGSLASARVVCPLLLSWLAPESVLDVGCGAGAWCRVWSESGVKEVQGTDGDYVDRQSLLIPAASFRSQDLSQAFDFQRKFALVASLEVAEHIPEVSARTFAENLARHGDAILFSAAVPGQGGEFHVNEQPLGYWKRHFEDLGFSCFDAIRPAIVQNANVEPWYRYNTLLYVRGEALARLPSSVLSSRVEGEPTELAPLTWRARNAVLGSLPKPIVNALVQAKHAWGRKFRPANQ
jgi:SAM-dependent methyltransferase